MLSLSTRAIPIVLVLCGTLSAGCDSGSTSSDSLDLSVPLAGTDWTLVAFGEGGKTTDAGTTTISLTFAEEELSGSSVFEGTTRNTYWGSYKTGRGGELFVYSRTGEGDYPGVTATRVGEPEGSRIDDYVLALRQVSAYGFDGDTLVLTDGEQPLLRFEPR